MMGRIGIWGGVSAELRGFAGRFGFSVVWWLGRIVGGGRGEQVTILLS